MFLMLFLSLFFKTQAHAKTFVPYPYEEIKNPGELVILGKGIRAKHTDQAIALVCVDQSCSTLRYAVFDQYKAAFFGPSMSKVDLDSATSVNRAARPLSGGRGAGVMFLLIGGSVFLAPITAVPVVAFLGITAIMSLGENQSENFQAVDVYGRIQNEIRKNKAPTQEGKVFLSQEGWNWSVRGKKVSVLKYCETIASILEVSDEPVNGYYQNYQVGSNSFVAGLQAFLNSCENTIISTSGSI